MRWEIQLFVRDRDGNQRSCSMNVEGLDTVTELVAFASAFGDRVQALSTGQIVGATLTARWKPSIPTVAQLGSNVARKLLVLCTDTENFGSVLIPSPAATLPFDLADAEQGYRIPKGYLPVDHPIALGIAALAAAVTPTGAPFPVDNWVLARITS